MADITAKQEPTPEKKGSSKSCRYFKKGFCGFGEKCLFRHNYPKSRSNNGSGVENCRFYKKASCKFAFKCWNKHIPPNGKKYPRPGPLNKFIVVGPSGEEPDKIEDTSSPVKDSAAIFGQESEIRRSFRRPPNQDQVSKNCFYYEKEGTCYYEDKCWYSHSESYTHPTEELLHEANLEPEPAPDYNKMCYEHIFKVCEFGDDCPYVHGDICQYCDLPFLHPFDEEQRNDHLKACEIFFLEDMDIAFKFMNSKDKMCVICLEYVWGKDKPFNKQKFGIQDKCNHIFCLRCIRKWRSVKRKSGAPLICPACRVESPFVVPSARWFENEDEKAQWVKDYKDAIARKPCKFYAKGNCRMKGECKYDHSGFKLDDEQYLMEDGADDWTDSRPNNQLPSGEQEVPGNRAAEDVTDDRDQQDARWRDLPEQEPCVDTPPEDQTHEGLDLQSGQPVVPSNMADDHQFDDSLGQVNVVDDGDEQNVERHVCQDPDISGDTSENQPKEDLLLQSSDNISPENLSETMVQQCDDNLEQPDLVDDDEKEDEEHQVVEHDPNASFDKS